MDAEEAAATGAHRDEVDPSDLAPDASHDVKSARHRAPTEADLQVPGGATDPLWYLAARHLAPHMETTRKRGWVEGFVAALELVRGVNVELAGVGEVLRDSVDIRFESYDWEE